jgi:hypothetical protein
VKGLTRSLLIFLLFTTAVAGQTALRQVKQARALLGGDVWSRVIRVDNTARHGIYPSPTYALVFEFNGILWFYTPYDGTQSFSIYRGRLEQDKNDFTPLLRAIARGFASYTVVPETAGEARKPAWILPNGCFIESLVALRQQLARKEVTRAALLSYYYGPDGHIGHTVLTYDTSDGFYVIDPANSARPAAVDRRLASDAMELAVAVHPSSQVVRARFLPVDHLTMGRPGPASTAVANLDAGGGHPRET